MAKPNAAIIAGKTVVFVGNESEFWGAADIASAARRARVLGIDSLCVKRADGTRKWYSSPEQIAAEYKAAHEAGMGYIPIMYCYGPRFGMNYITEECAILREMQRAVASAEPTGTGFACADMEIEWDNNPLAAQRFCGLMQKSPFLLYITTWADPVQQGWLEVARRLDPCADAWVPQQYNDWLAAQSNQLGEISVKPIFPAVDVTNEFGVNHPVAIAQTAAQRRPASVWLWEYVPVMANRQLTQNIVAALRNSGVSVGGNSASSVGASGSSGAVPAPPSHPTSPAMPSERIYLVQPGDTLIGIAEKLGVDSWWNVYTANKTLIETMAKRHGFANSHNGDIIFPGERLVIA